MQGVYYLVMLVGVIWLCLWIVWPASHRGRYWWPFDMRDAGTIGSGGGDDGIPDQPGQPAWRQRAAAAALDLQHPLPKRRAAQSRGVRRKPAAPSGRQR